MALAVVRSLRPQRDDGVDLRDFEQELIDQYALAQAAAGLKDGTIAGSRLSLFEYLRVLGRPAWTAEPADADRYLLTLREQGHALATIYAKTGDVVRWYEFLIARYQGDIYALTGYTAGQPFDEFNRPPRPGPESVRIPPSQAEVDQLFDSWRQWLPTARKYLPAARDYLAASLWRRVGLRINETRMLDIRDWRADIGEYGKLHIRFGKGSYGRGPKNRLVPAINSVDALLDWWLTDVRHQFGDDWTDPDAPLLPSERRDEHTGRCLRIGPDALRAGLAGAVDRWLPGWSGRLSPHGLRHFCASSLYRSGVDLKAIQELLGHEWLSTTTGYINPRELHQTGEFLQVA